MPLDKYAGAFRLRGMKWPQNLVGPFAVTAIFGAIAAIFWPTFSYMLGLGGQENPTGTSAIVLLVTLVLVWNQRDELAKIAMKPFLPGLLGVILVGFIWLSGQLVFTRVFTQFAVLAMVPMAVLTLFGIRWLVALAFPFFILVFALPVWSPLVPVLVKWTAKFAEIAIQISGVPIFRDGAYFVLPSGSWSIADACSGVAYLSACLLLGVLYAWSMYHSPVKRSLFIAGAVVIGVVGNWIRVYLTMMIAHISDNRLLREDHGPFGWWLFAAFLAAYCWLGWRYRDDVMGAPGDGPPQRTVGAAISSVSDKQAVLKLVTISAAILVSLAIWPILESRLSAPSNASRIATADILPQAGWTRVDNPVIEWAPILQNPSSARVQSFEKGGQRVNVFVGIFQHESWTSKLVTVSNHLAGGDKSGWSLADRGSANTQISGIPLDAKTGIILGGGSRTLAWHWYWIDGASTSSDLRAKLQQLAIRLKGAHPTAAWVAIYTQANTSSDAPSALLKQFMLDMGGSLEKALVQTGKKSE